MDATSFFTDSQAQFNESQKKVTALWDEAQKELSESQKKLFQSWMDNFSQGTTLSSPAEGFEKSLSFQRELVDSALNAQQVAVRLSMETQKQFWDNYFQTTQKMSNTMPKS